MDGIKLKMQDGSIKYVACYYYEYNGYEVICLCQDNEVKVLKGVEGVWKI